LLERLKKQGVDRLLVEGGGELNWLLLREDLIDELFFTLAPSLLGGRDAPTPIEGEGLSMAQQHRLKLLEVERVGDELFTRWAVCR
jgi:2,5-diamino-6-(ribosylamino)-4(3H)-pyrimidinone 5'-phosphate reductase